MKVAPVAASVAMSEMPAIVNTVDTLLFEVFKSRSASLPSSTTKKLVESRNLMAFGVKKLATVPIPSAVAPAPPPATRAVAQRAVGDGSAESPAAKHDDGHAHGMGGDAPPEQ